MERNVSEEPLKPHPDTASGWYDADDPAFVESLEPGSLEAMMDEALTGTHPNFAEQTGTFLEGMQIHLSSFDKPCTECEEPHTDLMVMLGVVGRVVELDEAKAQDGGVTWIAFNSDGVDALISGLEGVKLRRAVARDD